MHDVNVLLCTLCCEYLYILRFIKCYIDEIKITNLMRNIFLYRNKVGYATPMKVLS